MATVSIATVSNVGDLYATTITPHDDTSHTDAAARRHEAAQARAQEEVAPTIFQARQPRPSQDPRTIAASLMIFADALHDARSPIPQRRTQPRPDGRFTPKRPR